MTRIKRFFYAHDFGCGLFLLEDALIWVMEQLEAFQWGFAGFIGALVASWFRRDDLKNSRDFALFAITGAVIAHFLTGAIAEYLEVSPANAGSIGFLLGLFGGTLAQAIIKMIIKSDGWQFIMSRWGGK